MPMYTDCMRIKISFCQVHHKKIELGDDDNIWQMRFKEREKVGEKFEENHPKGKDIKY